jgi:polyisoprenoid-binding protein YceI
MRAKRGLGVSGSANSRVVLAAIGLLASGLGPPAAFSQANGVYEIDPKRSRVEVHVFKAGSLSGLGDNHTIELKRFSGTASRAAGGPWQVAVVGESASLKVLDPNLSDSSRAEVQKTMLGSSQLDVARFPRIEIKSRSVTPGKGAGELLLEADLTLHGVARPVEFHIAWSEADRGLRAHGTEKLFLRDFGIEPIRKFLGSIQVRNDFEVVYDIRLIRRN